MSRRNRRLVYCGYPRGGVPDRLHLKRLARSSDDLSAMAERKRPRRSSARLRRKMRPFAAFVALADAGLCTVRARIEAVLAGGAGGAGDGSDVSDGSDVEAIHELRVAVRHLRAVAWAFRPVLSDTINARWKAVLRDTANAGSEARDWDVFIAETIAPALEREPGHPLLLALHETAQARRAVAYRAMMTTLSRDMRAQLGTLERDLRRLARGREKAGSNRGVSDGGKRLDAFARRRVGKARQHVRELAQAAHEGQTGDERIERVHRLRIGNKRLRYAIEALADVLPRRLRKRLHKKLVRRQTALGAVVDDAVARRLLCECLADLPKYRP